MRNGPILLVDDNSLEVLITKRSFRKLGLKTKIENVIDGNEAISFLKSGPRPSIILLDINMPNMGGLDFLKERQKNTDWASIPVIVLSSTRDKKTMEEAYKLGISGYMIKPIDFKEMTELLRAIVTYWSLSEKVEND